MTEFRTAFAIRLIPGSSAGVIYEALLALGTVSTVEIAREALIVTVVGTAAPSTIVSAILSTGNDAIIRGSGGADSAAVSILETWEGQPAEEADGNGKSGHERLVQGLARMVQVSNSMTVVDLTVRGLAAGRYEASIRQSGDMKLGAASTGPVWNGLQGSAASAAPPRGSIGIVTVGEDGAGSLFADCPFQVWEVIGRGMVVAPLSDQERKPPKGRVGPLAGVIARSAGVWENDKTICSCTGQTMWQEREEAVEKGMI